MLTIGKIGGTGGGQWRQPGYYTQQVAQGAEDYYSGKGEAPGTWAGGGAAALGLDGAVGDSELEALFDRCHPLTGAQLGRPATERSVRGVDLQMAVPKSVSTLWALADEYGAPEISGRVWEATHGAAAATLGYLERNACTSRAGAGGHIALRGEGFVGAVFPHRFSREGDPQIHVHLLVANMTMCGDAAEDVERGWRTLDARDLFHHQRAAGYLFQAELRERLSRDLGVEWTDVRKGAAEIAGVPRELLGALSKRRAQILKALDRDGRTGTPAETQIAALSTRKTKQSFDLSMQRQQWRALAQEHGFGPDEFRDALGQVELELFGRLEVGDVVARLVGEGGLTEQRSTFTRRDVIEQLAAAHRRGGSVKRIEELADRVIASDHVVALDRGPAGAAIRSGGRGRAGAGEPLFTTIDLLAVEAGMIDQSLAHIDAGAGVVPSCDNERFALRPGGLRLSPEQQEMVRQLVSSGAGVEVVRAKAGTGKTTAIDAARELWEHDDFRVIGTALSGRAADELRARGGMDSFTLHGLLANLDRGDDWALTAKTVVVVDEAGMVDSRRLAALLDHAANAGAKVVLIGDERQVPAVETGGAFAALANRLGAIELTEVHRQRHAWDRAALDELRHGDISAWAAAYERHGRLTPCQGADQQVQMLVEHWYVAAHEHGMVDTVMLASRRDEVDSLNSLARSARVAADELDDSMALTVAGRSYATGDRVLALRNRRVERADHSGTHQLRNGNRATVTHVDLDRSELNVSLDNGLAVTLPAEYLRDGHLSHGYATTIHKAQGMTTARAFVLGSPDLARELGYVASSRHTEEARFFINAGTADEPGPTRVEDQPFYADLARALGRERAKHLALDETEIDAQLGRLTTTELLEISDRGRSVLTTIPAQARRAKDAQLLDRAATNVTAAENRLATAHEELATGRFDGQGQEQLLRRIQGLEAALDAARLQLAERTDAAAAVDADRWIEQHEVDLIEATAAERELASRRADAHWRATHAAALDADPATERDLGQRPDAPGARERWERAAAAQESYRLQYGDLPGHDDPTNLTGRQAADWHHAHQLAEKLLEPPEAVVPDLSPGPDLGW